MILVSSISTDFKLISKKFDFGLFKFQFKFDTTNIQCRNGTARFKNVNNCWNINISFYLETSGGQSSNIYLNGVYFSTQVLIRHLWQLKAVVFPALLSNLRSSITFFESSFKMYTLPKPCMHAVVHAKAWMSRICLYYPKSQIIHACTIKNYHFEFWVRANT